MNNKIVHSLEHVNFEDAAALAQILKQKGYGFNRSALYNGDTIPPVDSFELLLIMGGSMGVYDEDKFNWLKPEKIFIEKCIAAGKKIIGICLGAQLLADVLGARVYKNKYKEIGWHSVNLTEGAGQNMTFRGIPAEFVPFHWHGDTFDIPSGCIKTAESEACPNQAFVLDERILALQFHLESTDVSINNIIKHSSGELIDAPYIQKPDEILKSAQKRNAENIKLLDKLLSNFLN